MCPNFPRTKPIAARTAAAMTSARPRPARTPAAIAGGRSESPSMPATTINRPMIDRPAARRAPRRAMRYRRVIASSASASAARPAARPISRPIPRGRKRPKARSCGTTSAAAAIAFRVWSADERWPRASTTQENTNANGIARGDRSASIARAAGGRSGIAAKAPRRRPSPPCGIRPAMTVSRSSPTNARTAAAGTSDTRRRKKAI